MVNSKGKHMSITILSNYLDFKMLNIQGLRALSIVAVLIFHLRPDISGMGHLGVDV
jgi:hypothetical protein